MSRGGHYRPIDNLLPDPILRRSTVVVLQQLHLNGGPYGAGRRANIAFPQSVNFPVSLQVGRAPALSVKPEKGRCQVTEQGKGCQRDSNGICSVGGKDFLAQVVKPCSQGAEAKNPGQGRRTAEHPDYRK